MWDFWTARPPLPELLGCLPLMRPRRYSIASSPGWYAPPISLLPLTLAPIWRPRLKGPAVCRAVQETMVQRLGGAFDLCVAVVSFTTRSGRQGQGLCSGFLQRLQPGARVRCSFERGSLSLPPLEVPLILVCPGTGLSPCRALVQQRHLQVASTGAVEMSRFLTGQQDLIFLGFRHQRHDFLYSGEWDTFRDWLMVHVAFSRDHEDRTVYVQDMIEDEGDHVCRLLDAGARIYVCGRSHPMPSQVFDAFVEVLEKHRGLSLEASTARLRDLQRTQHYICDTWG